MTDADALTAGAVALGVELDAAQLARLVAFADLLRRWNGAFNLVSRGDIDRLIPRHLLDALSLTPRLRGRRVVDLGTGAGLPGVPLAIAMPELQFTLVDRNERRVRFVQQARIELDLANVEPVVSDFASFRPATLFDTVVSRAVAKPAELWRVASPLLAAEGIAVLQVGAGEHDVGAANASARTECIRIPGIEQPRHIMTIRRAQPSGQVER